MSWELFDTKQINKRASSADIWLYTAAIHSEIFGEKPRCRHSKRHRHPRTQQFRKTFIRVPFITFSRDSTHANLSVAEIVLLQLLDLSTLVKRHHGKHHKLKDGRRFGVVDVIPAPPGHFDDFLQKRPPLQVFRGQTNWTHISRDTRRLGQLN